MVTGARTRLALSAIAAAAVMATLLPGAAARAASDPAGLAVHTRSQSATDASPASSTVKPRFALTARASRSTVGKGHAVSVTGTVRPKSPHAKVTLQTRVARHWRTVKTIRLSRSSHFAFTYRSRSVGAHLLRVLKPASRTHRAGISRRLTVTVRGVASARSHGHPMTLRLGAVTVHAPRGAIRPGATLTVRTGAPSGYGSPGAASVGGGLFTISTSQGEPNKPVTVTFAYDSGLLARGDHPRLLHGLSRLHRWAPEPTRIHAAAHTVSASLSTFSPLDVVGNLTWVFGDLTGNRTDLPTGCTSNPPSWAPDAVFAYGRNDPLPMCTSSRSNASTLYLNLVNNRGYAQLVHVVNAKISVSGSTWGDSLEANVARGFAHLETSTANSTIVLAAGDKVTIAIPKPAAQLGSQLVTIRAAAQGGSAVAALGWAFLAKAKSLATPVDVTNCVIGHMYATLNKGAAPASSLNQMRACVSGAASLAANTPRVKALRSALEKIGAAVLAVDVLYKVYDLRGDELYPPNYSFDIIGINPTNPKIVLTNTHFGTLPAGQTTVEHLGATGGTSPYNFRVWNDSANLAGVPAWVTVDTDGTVTVNPPAGTSASVWFAVYAFDATGRHSPFAANAISFGVTPDGSPPPIPVVDWQAPHQLVGSGFDRLTGVSCASLTACAAIDESGHVLNLDGTTWSAPDAVATSGFADVSCATATTCVAVGSSSGYAVYDGSSWSTPQPVATDVYLTSVSCPSATFCMALGGSNDAFTFDGASWSGPTHLTDDGYLGAVSCPSTTFCMVVGSLLSSGAYNAGQAVTYTNGAWGVPTKIDDVAGVVSVSCVSASFCMAIDSGTGALRFNGSAWSSRTVINDLVSSGALAPVSCASPTFCVEGDYGGDAFVFDGTSWSYPYWALGRVEGASCPKVNQCVLVDSAGNAATYDGGWEDPVTIDGSIASAHAVSCSSESHCAVATGSTYGAGGVAELRDGTWSVAQSGVYDGPLDTVSCPTDSFCAGARTGRFFGFGGYPVQAFDGDWIRPRYVYGATYGGGAASLSCASASYCVGVGDGLTDAIVYNGYWSRPSSADIFNTNPGPSGVSCVTSTFCVAVGGSVAYTFDGTSWSSPVSVDGGTATLAEVSCSSVTRCVAVGSGRAYVYDHGLWSAGATVDTAGNALVFNGQAWSAPEDIDGAERLAGISCPTRTFCLAVDADGSTVSGSAVG